jgi:hypothetical protein
MKLPSERCPRHKQHLKISLSYRICPKSIRNGPVVAMRVCSCTSWIHKGRLKAQNVHLYAKTVKNMKIHKNIHFHQKLHKITKKLIFTTISWFFSIFCRKNVRASKCPKLQKLLKNSKTCKKCNLGVFHGSPRFSTVLILGPNSQKSTKIDFSDILRHATFFVQKNVKMNNNQ